jgi:hypothetical protein
VPPVRAADGGDLAGVTVRSKPIVHRRANGAAADRRLSRTLVASDQQDEAVASRNRVVERAVDGPPRGVEAHPVEVDDAVRPDRSATKAAVPTAVEGRAMPQILPGTGRWQA